MLTADQLEHLIAKVARNCLAVDSKANKASLGVTDQSKKKGFHVKTTVPGVFTITFPLEFSQIVPERNRTITLQGFQNAPYPKLITIIVQNRFNTGPTSIKDRD